MNWVSNEASFLKVESIFTVELRNREDLEVEFYEYAAIFFEAGYILAISVLENKQISELDTYIYSISYLYRHSLELMLKAIGFKYITETVDRIIFLKETNHNLHSTLLYLEEYLTEFTEKDSEAYNWIKAYFEDLNEIDKNSDSFRYPFKSDYQNVGSISLFFEKQIHIDLVLFANKFRVAYEILENIYHDEYGKSDMYKGIVPIFIEEGGSYHEQSVIGYNYDRGSFYPFIAAYKESAEIIYQNIFENISKKGNLVLPMCYLYRNAVELSLKGILFEECSFDFSKSLRIMRRKNHSIRGLWNSIKPEIEKHADTSKEEKTIEIVENYVDQLHNFDLNSDKFRYPVDKNLNLHFKTDQLLDVENIKIFFEQLLNFLSGVNYMMAAHNDDEREMEQHYSLIYY